MSSLSPLHTIGDQIREALLLHTDADRGEGERRTIEMLRRVGFPNPAQAFRTYPFELSGGLRQRAMIAMALVCDPALLIADEPTTALDVTIQAQILQLMQELQKEFQMAILFITHDLGVVANMADDVVVLYRGRVMESGSCADLLTPARGIPICAPCCMPCRACTCRRRASDAAARGAGSGRALLVRSATATALGRAAGRRAAARGRRPAQEPTASARAAGSAVRPRRCWRVDDVSFTVERGESFGLVGESGCGKTTVSKAIMRAVSTDAGTHRRSTPPTGRSTCWRCRATRWSASADACSTSSRTRSTRSTRA